MRKQEAAAAPAASGVLTRIVHAVHINVELECLALSAEHKLSPVLRMGLVWQSCLMLCIEHKLMLGHKQMLGNKLAEHNTSRPCCSTLLAAVTMPFKASSKDCMETTFAVVSEASSLSSKRAL